MKNISVQTTIDYKCLKAFLTTGVDSGVTLAGAGIKGMADTAADEKGVGLDVLVEMRSALFGQEKCFCIYIRP